MRASLLICGIAAASLAGAPAAALTITQTVPIDFASVGSGVLIFDGFDAARGELVAVRAAFRTANTLTGEFVLQTRQIGPPGNFEAETEIEPLIDISIAGLPLRDRRDFTRSCRTSSVDTCAFDLDVAFDLFSDGDVFTDLDVYFGGAGSIVAPFAVTTSFRGFVGDLLQDDTVFAGSGDVTLTYDFVPNAAVPLPAGAALLLTGIAALSAASRRRGRSRERPRGDGPGLMTSVPAAPERPRARLRHREEERQS